MPVVNGKHYDYGDITVFLPNGPQVEAPAIEYSDEVEVSPVYGQGRIPRGYGMGQYKGEGKITLNREGFDALMAYCQAVGKPLYKLAPFNITVTYANDEEALRVDKLKGCKFKKRSFKGSEGDTKLSVEMEFVILYDIECDGVSAIGKNLI